LLLAACPAQPGTTAGDPTSSTEPGGSSTAETAGTPTDSTTGGPTSNPDPTSTSSEASATSSDDSEGLTTDAPTTTPVDSSSTTTGGPSTDTTDATTGGTTVGPDPSGPLFVENPGFEADFVAAGDYDDTIVPAGWTAYDPQGIVGEMYNSLGVLNPTGTVLYPDGAPEGSNVALVFLWHDPTAGNPVGVVQQLGDVLEPDTQYTLRVQVGNIAPMGNPGYELAGFPGYRVELLAGDVVLAADDDTLNPADGEFLQSEVVFTSTAADPSLGTPLAIRLVNKNTIDSGIEVNFDAVELHAAPAP
jgi:hypothetical protein